jgi:hypothetical protein
MIVSVHRLTPFLMTIISLSDEQGDTENFLLTPQPHHASPQENSGMSAKASRDVWYPLVYIRVVV